MGSLALSSRDFCSRSKWFCHLASVQNDERLGRRRVSFDRGRSSGFTVRAVAQIEPKCRDHDDQVGDRAVVISCSEVGIAVGLDVRETSRRMKISRANRGIVPWNKGKKHSAETIQKIRERTRIAMQSPKVRMKLVNFGHRQSNETRMKIGAAVRIGWRRRREKMKVQATCFYAWQNLIAEASRKGLFVEKEMKWNSYNTLDEQLEKEWLESIEQRKSMPRLKGVQRASKSPEQKRRIAEAIAAKWADPDYRERVCSGMAKHHGTAVGSERKPRRRPVGIIKSTRQNLKKKTNETENASSTDNIKRSTVQRSNKPLYEDPLASSKLEMIKNIRSQRKAADSEIAEAVERARLLIAQAEKAAEALEFAATRSATAQASLLETRKLIAEAIELIEAVEKGEISSNENVSHGPSGGGTGLSGRVGYEKIKGSFEEPSHKWTVNGRQSLVSGNGVGFDFSKFTLQNVLNLDGQFTLSGSGEMDMSPNGTQGSLDSDQGEESPGPVRVTKKWVRGRLVEVVDEA
ncbi:uncharacterized protein LOC116211520 isoform X2 [Punica granatum]|uniref:Uncharacterized protein LOC116211520 isoform X2 n=1 Tax=Punica granatum TaxID=22663 RepID=A0A6P8E9D9_PUNGR|nr:uncharacterized protein LOC116211520 isoform X2 [Punica granatum]